MIMMMIILIHYIITYGHIISYYRAFRRVLRGCTRPRYMPKSQLRHARSTMRRCHLATTANLNVREIRALRIWNSGGVHPKTRKFHQSNICADVSLSKESSCAPPAGFILDKLCHLTSAQGENDLRRARATY